MNIMDSFSTFYKEVRKLLDVEYVCDNEDYLQKLEALKGVLTDYSKVIIKLNEECELKIVETKQAIEDDGDFELDSSSHQTEECISNKPKLNWADMVSTSDKMHAISAAKKKEVEAAVRTATKESLNEYKELRAIEGVNIGKCTLPVIRSLDEIKPALFWYNGDNKHIEGIYTSIAPNLIIQVPFPNVKDVTRATITQNATNIKKGSIKCRYETAEKCEKIRKSVCQQRNVEYRDCDYAHIGDKYVKIGSGFRCPVVPSFGAHSSLTSDLKRVTDRDVKVVLMYALSDVLLSSIWWQNIGDSGQKIVLNDIDVCS